MNPDNDNAKRARQLIEACRHSMDINTLIDHNLELAQIVIYFATLEGNTQADLIAAKEAYKQAEAAKIVASDGSVAKAEREAIIDLSDQRDAIAKFEGYLGKLQLQRRTIAAYSDSVKQKIANLRSEWELSRFAQK
jgi:hypothetical protein